ncbi:RHS repeat-associated core domain-containing protein [Micromonospora sp. NPDC048871]|uniref:RHS repeat-associated core domain-containing protein n=1 Tax=unclassified Micromonospora TaxID=2617518 RepID=UPI002E1321F4|nr:hypothetical protein OIE53_01760 [Micromonospora sp. NBC_01739]
MLDELGGDHQPFGRITTLPSGLTNTYHVNDLVQQQQGDARQSWTLDPQYRFRTFTAETLVGGAVANAITSRNHYGDDSDEPRWIVEDITLGTITRNVSGPDGDLAATTSAGEVHLQLANLHGDIAVTIDSGLTEPEVFDFEEFGAPIIGQADQRYGWLGGKQRSGDALGDVILMGVRLYDPAIGRFLSVDPVQGGSANDYDYAYQDPVNSNDLDGRCPVCPIAVGIGVRVALRYAARHAARRAAQQAQKKRIIKIAGRPPARIKSSTPASTHPNGRNWRGRSWGYQINYTDRHGRQRVYKYGITSVAPPQARAEKSRRQCAAERYARNCRIVKIKRFPHRPAARAWEYASCLSYVIRYGSRPRGMRKNCR